MEDFFYSDSFLSIQLQSIDYFFIKTKNNMIKGQQIFKIENAAKKVNSHG